MFCIKCQQKTKVINSRHGAQKALVWRRRHCITCHYTFTTYESLASDQLVILKRGKEESFSNTRLLLSIARCFEHIPEKQADYALSLSGSIVHKLMGENGDRFSIEKLVITTFETLKNFDRLSSVQYAARHSDYLKKQLRYL